ncbi:MAG: hypothetical protein HQK84_12235, partial [Nitrospinae bacterium]|nr:hypothetical protein [Nitrospinota bacterium]
MEETLRVNGFKNIPTSLKNLQIIEEIIGELYPRFFELILLYSKHSFDPDEGVNNFERYISSLTEIESSTISIISRITQEKIYFYNLFLTFSGSRYLSDLVVKQPDIVEWLF